jgi:hypothetical protein
VHEISEEYTHTKNQIVGENKMTSQLCNKCAEKGYTRANGIRKTDHKVH